MQRQLSKGQWEELRPLIRRLYIEESRALAYIANVFRESHNFNPMYEVPDSRHASFQSYSDSLTAKKFMRGSRNGS
jgi:hypothetical protein